MYVDLYMYVWLTLDPRMLHDMEFERERKKGKKRGRREGDPVWLAERHLG